jgi:hypothetical protein
MAYLALALAAQFLYAVSILIDRHIVLRATHIGRPIVYAFYVSLLSGFVFVLVPFVSEPGVHALALSLVNAAAFVAAIFCLYTALLHARASDVAPVVGAVSAIVTLVFAGLWIEGDITASLVLPVLLLAGGTALISHFHFSRNALFFTLLSGLFFGAAAFTFKLVSIEIAFVDSFFWTRAMNVALALAFLTVPAWRSAIFHGGRHSSSRAKGLVLGNKVIGGIASVMTALAISLGSVTIVNSLAGLQFVFLFILAFLFAKHMPKREGSRLHGHGGTPSATGVALIVLGLALLSLGHYLNL